jgi:RNA 3'-terminal phosphate cyclase (ATP)
VLAAAAVCRADLRGGEIGSTEILFTPHEKAPSARSFEFDVAKVSRGGSAGSVILVLQTVLLPLAFSRGSVDLALMGGTHVAWSPPYDYFAEVYLPTLSRMGLDAGCTLASWGFYPVGGGAISVKIGGIRPRREGPPRRSLSSVRLIERGDLIGVSGKAVAANLPKDIADRMARRAADILGEKGIEAQVTSERVGGRSTGAGIFLTARYAQALAGFSALGKKGLPAERVALDACRELLAFHKTGASVDSHLADQLVLPLALAEGRSEMAVESVTSHLLANAEVVRRFIPASIEVEGEEGDAGRVAFFGIGMEG